MRRYILVAILLSILLTSCTVTESLSLKTQQNGTILSDITVQQFFVEVLDDFGEFLPEGEDKNTSLLAASIKGFEAAVGDLKSTSGVKFTEDKKNHYIGTIEYTDLHAMITGLGADPKQSVIKTTANSFSFFVDMGNYKDLKQMIPFLSDPNFEVFLPEYNVGMSEDEYLEMVSFLLGDESPDAIRESNITIKVHTPGVITSVKGGVKTGAQDFSYTFRLIDFLLLGSPLSFSVTWK